MAIFYPDLSHYDLDRGVTVAPGTVAVIAKATHGTLFVDRGYTTIRQQALNVGALFGGYHWLNHGNASAQADFYFATAGKTPCMVDAEDTDKNTGYTGPLTVADIVEFVTRLRARGGVCNLVYLPRWYWDQHMGGPSLQPLQDLGVGLVASNYTTYSDNGPGWNVYRRDNGAVEPSGMRPVCWQYTNALPYGGGTSDFNAYAGTLDQFRALLNTVQGGGMSSGILIGSEPLEQYLPRIERALWWPIPAIASDVAALKASAAGEATAIAGLKAAVDALAAVVTKGGGNVDVAAITTAVDAAAGGVKTLVEQRHADEMAALKASHDAQVAALQAQVDALKTA